MTRPTALVVAVAWVGYTATLWGYCLMRRYNVTITQLLTPTWPGLKNPGGTESKAQQK